MFVDIHNHMAWNIDDGMQIQEQAELALQNAMADGVRKIIATPHVVPGSHSISDIKKIRMRIAELKQLASLYDIDIYQGAEVFLNHSYLDMVDAGLCSTLHDSHYLLVEFDVRKDMKMNEEAEDMLYEIKLRGYIPVIAHAERYFHTELDVKRIQGWIAEGCVIQVNRTSILGMHGEVCKSNAARLLKAGLVHVVASDAHRATGHRICTFSDVYEHLKSKYGEDNAKLLCEKNPLSVINDQAMERMQMKKMRSLHQLFRKR